MGLDSRFVSTGRYRVGGLSAVACIAFSLGLSICIAMPAWAQIVTAGSGGVGSSGAFTYQIPIKVPPGTAGVEPKLVISYNSQAGNGLLGVGWSLEGLPSITHCPKTLAQDGVRGAVNYDTNDRYCLDGRRLVAISGSYGASGTEYRTELDGFSKIVSYNTNAGGPLWFKVWTKTGIIMEFGNTDDSRIEAQGKDAAATWLVNKMSDIKGNYLTVTYTENIGSYTPTRIDYTGNATAGLSPSQSVRFTYETRSDTTTLYHAGSSMTNALRMTHIKTYVGETVVKDYAISYGTGSTTGRSIVTGIAECDGTGNCLPGLAMAYQQGSDTHTYWTYDDSTGAGIGIHGASPTYYADINGDGRTDLVRIVTEDMGMNPDTEEEIYQTTTYIALGKADGNFDYWTHTSSVPGAGYVNYFADVNGDGRADWIQVAPGTNQASIGLGQADGNFQFWTNTSTVPGATNNYQDYFADVNGDGMADWIQISRTSNTGQVALATGNGNFQFWTASFAMGAVNNYEHQFVDVNGDGKADWIEIAYASNNAYVGLSNGDGTFQSWTWTSTNIGAANNWQHYLIDINGDGLADWIQISNTSNAGYVGFGRGDGSFGSWDWSNSSIGAANSYAHYFADINGDGYPDWIQVQRSANNGWIGLNNGQGHFIFWTNSSSSRGAANNYSHTFVDVNGDGKADWIQSGATDGHIGLANGQVPDLLTSITTGLGAVATVTYKPLSDASVYTKDSGTNAAIYPVTDIQGPMYVVSTLANSNGIGGTLTTNYTYTGFKYDATGRGSLGFRITTQTDAATGLQVQTTFRQDFPYIGLPSQTKKTQSSGAVLNQVDTTYNCNDFNGSCIVTIGGHYFTYATQNVESGNDLNGAVLPTVTTTNQFDIFGNLTQVTSSTGDGYSKTTTNSYINDTLNWFLGRLTRTQITATKP